MQQTIHIYGKLKLYIFMDIRIQVKLKVFS
jgi:hypothetical protein